MVDDLAVKYESYLSLIFGKWLFFKERGLDPVEHLCMRASRAFNWHYWFMDLVLGSEEAEYYSTDWLHANYLLTQSYLPDSLDHLTENGAQALSVALRREELNKGRKKASATYVKEMLPLWEFCVREAIYRSFFNVWLGEYLSYEPRNSPTIKKIETETLRFDRIWSEDPEIYNWIMKALTGISRMYSEQAEWYEQRTKRVEALQKA